MQIWIHLCNLPFTAPANQNSKAHPNFMMLLKILLLRHPAISSSSVKEILSGLSFCHYSLRNHISLWVSGSLRSLSLSLSLSLSKISPSTRLLLWPKKSRTQFIKASASQTLHIYYIHTYIHWVVFCFFLGSMILQLLVIKLWRKKGKERKEKNQPTQPTPPTTHQY